MADLKIRDLPLIAALNLTDVFEVTEDPAGTPASRKATVAQMRTAVLPTGIAGGVMVFTTAWGSTAAGTARQVFTSGGGAVAPGWGQDVLPLTQRAVDGLGTSVTTCAVIAHDLSGGGGGGGIGARCEIEARNSAGALVAASAIDGVLATATAGAEVAHCDVWVQASGALVRSLRASVDSLSTYTGAAWVPLFARTGGEWVYGSDDVANGGNAVLLASTSAGLYLRRGAVNHIAINSAGALTVGNSSFQTTIAGSRIVLQTPIAVHDANASSVVTAATIAHTLSSGSAAAGIGARATLAAHNASGTLTDAVAIDGILTNVGAGTEAGALAISTRTAGGALTERLRVHGAGGVTIGSTQSLTSGAGLANGLALWARTAADNAWFSLIASSSNVVTIGDTNNSGVILTTGASSSWSVNVAGVNGLIYRGYLTGASGTERQLQLSEPIAQSGTAGWTLLELSPTLTTQGTGAKRAISFIVSGSERFGVNELGRIINGNATNEATSATAGTNGATPAQVAGYLLFQDSAGNTRKIPYYAN